MTLDEFIKSEMERLARFKQVWQEGKASEPQQFPDTLPSPNDWLEQLDFFERDIPFVR